MLGKHTIIDIFLLLMLIFRQLIKYNCLARVSIVLTVIFEVP